MTENNDVLPAPHKCGAVRSSFVAASSPPVEGRSIRRQQNKSNLLPILIVLLIFINLLFLGVFGFWFYQEKIVKKSQPSPSPVAIPIITPSVEPTPQPSVIPTPLPTPKLTPSPKTKSDLELIREAFAKKYSKALGDVNVTISKHTGPYASGGVKFSGEVGGAMWLAYKGSDGWIIVHDGQGTIPCEAIEPYDFPVDMVPECFRESDGTIVKRS